MTHEARIDGVTMSDTADLAALAAYASSLDASRLTPDTLRSAKACLIYGLAVGVGTRRARAAFLAAAATSGEAGTGSVTRLLDGMRTSGGAAAFANAVLLSGRVQGDSHPCGHLGGVVIPAALAAAEQSSASGAAFLSAMVAGYEVSLRIGRDHAADLSTRGFRTTPCYGVFGAAIAAGRIRAFDSNQMINAIGLAANLAGGLREYVDAGTEESPFQAGFAARNGLYVADLVSSGLGAAATALQGKAGFYRAFGAQGVDYGRRLTQELGTHFEFTTVTFKQYPACQFLRGIIRGVSLLRGRAAGAELQSMELRMHPYEADFIGVRFAGPFTSATQTVMSAPFCAALAWVSGTASFDGLRTFDDPRVMKLVRRIRVITDGARQRYEPHIRIALDNGSVLEWEESAGDSNYRLTWESAVQTTHQLCEEVRVPAPLARSLMEAADAIDKAPSVEPLLSAVVAATTV